MKRFSFRHKSCIEENMFERDSYHAEHGTPGPFVGGRDACHKDGESWCHGDNWVTWIILDPKQGTHLDINLATKDQNQEQQRCCKKPPSLWSCHERVMRRSLGACVMLSMSSGDKVRSSAAVSCAHQMSRAKVMAFGLPMSTWVEVEIHVICSRRLGAFSNGTGKGPRCRKETVATVCSIDFCNGVR